MAVNPVILQSDRRFFQHFRILLRFRATDFRFIMIHDDDDRQIIIEIRMGLSNESSDSNFCGLFRMSNFVTYFHWFHINFEYYSCVVCGSSESEFFHFIFDLLWDFTHVRRHGLIPDHKTVTFHGYLWSSTYSTLQMEINCKIKCFWDLSIPRCHFLFMSEMTSPSLNFWTPPHAQANHPRLKYSKSDSFPFSLADRSLINF